VVNIGGTFGTPVNDKEYQIPFRSTGKIDKITFALDPPRLTPSDVQKF
jgi:arylsulfatase